MLLDHGKPGHALKIHVTRDALCTRNENEGYACTTLPETPSDFPSCFGTHSQNLKHAHDKMEKGRGHLKLNAHTHVPGAEHPAHGLTLHSKPLDVFGMDVRHLHFNYAYESLSGLSHSETNRWMPLG